MRREIIVWSIVVTAILAAFGGTVLVLNASLYSAGGFVRSYIEAVARHDVAGALELGGTFASGDASTELLVADALGTLDDIAIVSDTADAQGVHRVVYSFTADGRKGESSFEVRRQGTLLGLFNTWAFQSTPLGVLQVSPLHAREFSVNGVEVTAPEQDRPSPYLVFAPGTYELSHDSLFLHADPVQVTSSQPGAAVIAAVDIRPTAALVEQVQSEIDAYLDECATQEVLLPTACPFGQQFGNRVVSTPKWSIVAHPGVALVPGPKPGSWLMPPTNGTAHLVVDVKSLFDGSVETFDEDVAFTASYVVTFLPGNEVLIAAQ